MPCCCVKTLNLCKVNVCGELEIDWPAGGVASGEDTNNYSLELDYLNTTVTLTKEQTEGENISFDISMLNENFEYTGKIYDSNGNLVSIESDGETYDCIKFKTRMNVIV